MNRRILELERLINYRFKNRDCVSIALCHPGVKKKDKNSSRGFERLEFLGDRVLGLSLASLLCSKFVDESEGDLAVRIATLAGTDFLIKLVKEKKIISCFSIPKDFFISKNKTSSSIADMMEAVLGAIFLDSDFETAKEVVHGLWKDNLNEVSLRQKDPKTQLQEMVQAISRELPVYRLIKTTGEAHDPVFEIEVLAIGKSAIGCGNSKKSAEHDAAKNMIILLEKNKVKN